jgi:hypothetical protein
VAADVEAQHLLLERELAGTVKLDVLDRHPLVVHGPADAAVGPAEVAEQAHDPLLLLASAG